MDGNSRRVIGISVLCFLVALVVFALYSIVTFQPKLVLPFLIWRWTWNQSLIFFIEALIPLQCTALLLYYSLANPVVQRKRRADLYAPFYRMVNGVLVTLLIFTMLFAVLTEGVRPALYAKRKEMLHLTSLAHLYYFTYQSYLHRSNQPEAARYLALYVKINPKDAAAEHQLDQLKSDLADAHLQASVENNSSAAPAQSYAHYQDESARSLVSIARSYLQKTDYASAHYYANLALAVSPDNGEARQISDQSLRDLSRITTSPAERKQKYYFALKSEGSSDLEKGDIFDAYYLFRSLSADHPNDPDVVTYLGRATDELKQFAFFRDEIEKAAPYPGTRNVLFVNRRDRSGTQVVLFGKMVTLISGTFMENIDVIQLSASGKVVYQITAPYAKVIDNRLSMFCIDRTKPVRYLPTVLRGSFPDSSRWQLPLSAGIGTLDQIASSRDAAQLDGMPRLWSLARSLPRYGYPADALHFEFLRRVMVPFGYLILSIFSIGMGWSLRPPGRRPSGFVFLLVPLVPYTIYLFQTFYLFSGKILFAFITTVAGFWPALVTLLIVQFALTILSLVYLSGRSVQR